jgi:hypothetical protein
MGGTDALARAMFERLRLLGTRISEELPGYSWHVESNDSRVYGVSGLLVIVRPGSDEDAAVLSITRDNRNGRWNIDAVGKDAVWLGDARYIPESLNTLMSADAEVADWILNEVAARLLDLIVRHLTENDTSHPLAMPAEDLADPESR